MGNVVADLVVRVRGDVGGAVSDMGRVNQAFSGLAQGMKTQASGLASVISTGIGFVMGQMITRIAGGVASLAKTGLDFGRNMANVNSIAQLTDSQIQQLSKSVIAIASDPRITDAPATIAAGLYDVVSSGFAANDALVIVKAGAMAATAGLTDTATATRAITAVLNAYSLGADQAGKVSDQLFQIVNLGVLSFPQLASTIGTVLPMANALGVSVDQLGAAYAVMTRQGVSADEATTQISAIMTGLLKPSADMTAGLQAMGYESGLALIQQKGLGGAVGAVNQIIQNGTGNIGDYVSNVRDMRGLLSLTKNDGKAYADMLTQMGHAQDGAGMTAKALSKQMESASFRIAKMKQEVQIFATLLIGALSPAIILVAAGMTKLLTMTLIPVANAFNDLSAAMMLAFNPGKGVNTILSQMPGYLQGIAKPFLTIADNLGRVGRGIEGAFGAGKGIKYYLHGVPEILQESVLGLLKMSDALGDLDRAFRSGGIKGFFKALPDEAQQFVSGLGGVFSGLAAIPVDVAIDIKNWVLDTFPDVWKWLHDEVFGKDSGIGGKLGDSITGGKGKPLTLDEVSINIGNWVAGEIPKLWTWLQDLVTSDTIGSTRPSGIGGKLGDSITGGRGKGITIAEIAINVEHWTRGAIPDLWGWIKGAFTGAVQLGKRTAVDLASVAVNVAAWVKGVIPDLWATVSSWFTGAVRLGKQAAVPLGDIAVSVGHWLVNAAETLGDAVMRFGSGAAKLGKQSAIPLGDVAVDIAGWTLHKVGALWGWLVTNVPPWPEIAAGTKTVLYTVEDALVDIKSWKLGTVAESVWTFIQDNLSGGGGGGKVFPGLSTATGNSVTFTDYTINIGDPAGGVQTGEGTKEGFWSKVQGALDDIFTAPAGTAHHAFESGQGVGKDAASSFWGGFMDLGNWELSLVQGAVSGGGSLAGAAGGAGKEAIYLQWVADITGFITGFAKETAGSAMVGDIGQAGKDIGAFAKKEMIAGIKSAWSTSMGPDLVDLGGMISGWVSGLFRGTSTATGAAGSLAGLSSGDMTQSGGIVDTISGFFKDIPAEVKAAVGDIKLIIPQPSLPEWMTNWGWITDPINTLEGYIARLLGDKATADAQVFTPPLSSQGGGAFGLHHPSTGPFIDLTPGGIALPPPSGDSGDQSRLTPMQMPAPDTRLFDQGLADLGVKVDNWSKQTYKSTFDINTGPAAIGYTEAFKWGTIWAQQTFDATFGVHVDTSAIQTAINEASNAQALINSVGTPQVAFHAAGGTVTTPWSVTQEEGPELMKLPTGTLVYSARQSKGMLAEMGGGKGDVHIYLGGVTVTVAGDVVNADNLDDHIVNAFTDKIAPVLVSLVRDANGSH